MNKYQNHSSIYHESYERLFELTKNYNKATLLDKLIYWWQISTYTLPNSPDIWFTRSREQIAEDTGLSLRTIDRYLKEFEHDGLIEKVNKLFLKKHLYIRITNKLLLAIKLPKQNLKNEATKSESVNLKQDGSIDIANLATSIYKEKNNNLINSTVKTDGNVNLFQNPSSQNTKAGTFSNHYPQYPVEKIIGEVLTPKFVNYIKGMLQNIKNQHNINVSSPEQLYAEVVFAVQNKQYQFIGITDNVHRINLIAKLLRENNWRTPKGFFNYSEMGTYFKSLQNKNKTGQQKVGEGNTGVTFQIQNKPTKILNYQGGTLEIKQIQRELHDTKQILHTETRYYNEMKQLNEKTPSKITQMVIDTTAIKLEQLRIKEKQLQNKINYAIAA